MKSKSTYRHALLLLGGGLLAVSHLHATTFYWDNNDSTGGYGTASGTWAEDNTTVGKWTTSSGGTSSGSFTQATGSGDTFNFGRDTPGLGLGAGTITVSGAVNMGNTSYGSESGAIVLTGGTINFGSSKIITVNNASNTIASEIGAAATKLTKAGTGTLALTGTNTYTVQTVVDAGTLDLGGSTPNGSLSSTVLSLGGGTFSYTRTGTNTQAFTTTNINAGASSVTTSLATQTLTLGNLAKGAGGTVDFSGAGAITTSTANTNGILGGWATHGGNTWAVGNGASTAISDLASYVLSSVAGSTAANYTDANIDVDSNQTPDAAITANTLRFNTAAANTLTLQSDNLLSSGGILVTSATGANLSTITGGTLAGTASTGLSVIQNNGSGGLTIASEIADNGGATALAKSGSGLLTLSGTNTFTGDLHLNEGEVAMGNSGALNSTNDVVVGASGTLTLNGNSVATRSLSGSSTGIVQNASATAATLTTGSASTTFEGVIQDGAGAGALALTKTGGGTFRLGGLNTFTGGLTLNGGQIYIGKVGSLDTAGAPGSTVTVQSNSTININGSGAITLDKSIELKPGAVLTWIHGNNAWTVPGAVTGAGGVKVNDSGSVYSRTLNLINTGNNFTGVIDMTNNRSAIAVGSLGDAVGAGNIVFDGSDAGFSLGTTAVAPLVLTHRQVELTAGGSRARIDNKNTASSHANTLTINSDLLVTASGGTKELSLGGANIGDNTFAGAIANGGLDSVSVYKRETGKWILSGANTYNGGTTVDRGTLAINGSLSDASMIISGTSPTVNGSGTLTFNPTDQIDISSGTLDISGFTIQGSGLTAPAYVIVDSVDGGSYTGGTFAAVNVPGYTVDYDYNGSGTQIALVSTAGGTAYENWATGSESFDGDANGDGVQDGLAFLLGALNPSEDASGRLPTISESGGDLIVDFDCLPLLARGGAKLKVAHSIDLVAWTTAEVPNATELTPDNDVTFVVSVGPLGPPALNSVTATIDSAAALGGGKLFGRLEASE